MKENQRWFSLFSFLLYLLPVSGQVNISGGNSITETFTALNNSSTTMPSGWKVDANSSVRTVGTYSSAGTTVSLTAGNSIASNASNGIYKFQANGSQTEIAVGGLSSGTSSKSVNVYVSLYNSGTSAITGFDIVYGVEKYRNGSNSSGYSVQMYYSTNGSSWTSAGNSFLTSFAADGNNNGFSTAPGTTANVSATLSVSLAASSNLYLAWNYSVSSGTTTSNAQALGIDDITIAAIACATPAPPTNSDPASVCGGTSVNITGTGSTNATSYSFWTAPTGGNSITGSTNPPGLVSGNTLTTPTTLSTGTYDYYVQGDNGSCASTRKKVTVTINPFPGTPNCSTPPAACAGTTATIIGTGSSNATGYSYWDASSTGNQITTSTTPPGTVVSNNLTTPTSLASGSYTYYVQGENGCGSSSARQSVTVTISDAPLTPTCSTPAAACYGNSVTITGAGSGSSATYTYWDAATGGNQITTGNPTGFSVSAGNLTSPATLASGNYTYYVQGEVGSCVSSRQAVTITINPLPADPPAPVAAANPACASTALTESAPPAGVTYYWQGLTDGGASPSNSSNTNSSYTANTVGTNTYYVRAQDDATLCWSASAGSVSVTVYSAIPAQPSFSGGSSSICQAASPGTYSIGSVSEATSYQWSLSSAGSSSISPSGSTTSTSATITWDAAYYGSATVSVTADNVCGSSPPGSWIVTVNQNLTPAVSISASPTGSVCSGTSVTFTASPSNLSSGSVTNYQWKKNGSNTGTNSSTYTSSALANNDVITCVITISGGCLTANTATSNSVTVTVISTPSTPVATAGTSVGASSFDANWNTVSGATSYLLDVATDSAFVSSSSTTLAGWDFEASSTAANSGITANVGNNISTSGGTSSIGYASGNGGNTARVTGCDNGSGTKYWEVFFSTTNYFNIKVSSKQRSSNTGPKNFKLQYKIGSSGTYTDVTSGTITVADDYTTGVLSSLALPSACNDQSTVYLRWIMTSSTAVTGGSVASTGGSNIDDIIISGSVAYYVTGYHDLSVSSPPQAVTGLNISGGTQYYYRVRATNSCGTSGYSNIITVNSCTSPNALAFVVQPSNTEQGSIMNPSVKVRAYCTATGYTATAYTGNITVSEYDGCGLVSQTAAAVEGIATFSNIVFTRSAQTGIRLKAEATGLTTGISNTFNITSPGGVPTYTTVKCETFETSSPIPWSYTVGTPSYTGSGGGTDVTGIKTFSSNKVLCKSYSTDNGTSEKKSTNTITFANVTGLSTYNSVTFSFLLASLGSGNGAGNDNGDDMSIEISLNNGASWSTLLTYYGSSDYLFSLSSSSPTSLAYNANQQYVSPSTKSKFTVTLPSGTSQFQFRMTAKNNRSNENWSIDSITLIGSTLSSDVPSPLPTATGGTVNTCPNTNTTISVTLTNTQGGVTYAWSPTTNISSTTISNPVVNVSTATTYTVTVTDADGCTATASEVISVPTGTAGNWTGSVNEDWFYCRNWGNGVVPDATVDVTVTSSASNMATIDPQSSFAAMYSGIAYSNSLLADNKKVNFANAPTLIVNGNLTIQNNGLIDMTTGGTLELKGNWDNQVGSAGFSSTLGTVKLSGSGSQTVSSTATNGETFNELTIAKSVQTLVDLSSNVNVNGVLSFTTGGIIKTNANKVTVSNSNRTSAITGYDAPNSTGIYNNDKYVQGNLERNITGTGMYDFPVGDAVGGEGYNPVQLNILSGSPTGYATAKFVAGDPGTFAVPYSNYFSCNGAGAFTEYTDMTGEGWWNFTSSTGTQFNYDIHLHPNQNNQNIYPNDAVTIGATVYNNNYRALKAPTGSAGPSFDWTNYAMLGDPCTVSSYYDIIGANYTGFSDFAPGGGFGNTTALPVELIYLEAKPMENRYIKVEWATATEINNLGFEVQRSTDGANFNPIGWVDGNNNSTIQRLYNYDDAKAAPNVLYYYRLKQVDYDGSFVYTYIVTAEIKAPSVVSVSELFPNPSTDQSALYITSPVHTRANIRLVDLLGRVVQELDHEVVKGKTMVHFDLSHLAGAGYSVLVKMDELSVTKRLLVSQYGRALPPLSLRWSGLRL